MLQEMLERGKISSVIASAVIAVSLLAAMTPMAMADSSRVSTEQAVTSTRSFPKVTNVRRDILVESTATDVDASSHWGSIENLNVPQTQTPLEAAADRARRDFADAAANRSSVRGELTGAPLSVIVPPNGNSAADLLNFASQFLGKVPYRSGGTTPAGWDCSGFVQYVFAHIGIALPRTSGAQATVGTPIPSLDQAQPGDIIANASHASIYVGNGMVINSQFGGTRYDAVRYMFRTGYSIRRVL